MKFTIYTADCREDETNTLYPNRRVISSAEELKDAVSHDHVCALYRGYHRSNDNYLESDCIPMDNDNDHSEDPADWICPEDYSDLLPGISLAVVPSRSDMKEKDGKSARPRHHVFFPVDVISDAEEYAAVKRGIKEAFPFFDEGAMDAARFLFGSKAETITWNEGEKTIDQVTQPVYEEEEKTENGMTGGIIPMGERNNTLSRFAGRVLKKFGDTDYAHQVFLLEADKCEEALSDRELKMIWRSALGFYRKKVVNSPGYVPPEEYNEEFGKPGCLMPGDYSDIGEAKVLAREYSDELLYTAATDYLRYDGRVWNESKQKAIGAMEEFLDLQLADARLLCAVRKQVLLDAGADKEAVESRAKKDIKAFSDEQMKLFLEYAKALDYLSFVLKRRDMKYVLSTLQAAKPMLEIDVTELDADPNLLNTPAGTLDLRKGAGSTRAHDPKDRITKITEVSPSEDGKEYWEDQIRKTFLDNKETMEYVQIALGEALFGKVENEHMTIAYGSGRNGKSTVINSCADVLGTYSGVISADVLTSGVRRNVKPEIAEIKGKRLLIAGELEEGMRLSTSIVKQLCSTDPIKGEKKYKDPFDFIPSHSLILYTNHLPKVGAMDEGIWRRLVVIPFNARFEGKSDIKNYTSFLKEHAGGYILTWLIEGAKKAFDSDFRNSVPPEVEEAIGRYRQNNDWFSHFLEECCETGEGLTEKSGEFYEAYRAFCARSGDYARSTSEFYGEAESRGLERVRKKDGRFIIGARLLSEFEMEPFRS